MRSQDGWFTTAALGRIFEDLRIPPVSNISAILNNLRKAGLIVRRASRPPWALSPLGVSTAIEALGSFDYARIGAELAGTPGAEFAHATHPVIPPAFAPPRWQLGIARLLKSYPFETNVFLMTRFPRDGESSLPDPLNQVIEVARTVVHGHGLVLHLASDRQIEDDLLGNVGAYMWACQYGIGLLENRLPDGSGLNDNMLIEIGSMLITGRRCAILKDRTSPSPPTDLSGQIYKSVNFDVLDTVSTAVHRWAAEDLGFGRCETCPPPVFDAVANSQ